jgi:5'-3' exoribonuclease 1
MGVKHFYLWYKKNFSGCIKKKTEPIDTLAIDMNGIFHSCAQKVYQYGSHSSHLLYHHRRQGGKSHLMLFREVCERIESLRTKIRPKKRLVLCVDGVAGIAKMNQQRQRRFKTGLTQKTQQFDPNCFTPGTKIMDHLTKYIDWYIRTMITLSPEWQELEVVFSNEKVPGEGEHKIIGYLKRFAGANDRICIYGLDADLMMLGILLPFDHIVIAREPELGFMEYVDIPLFREELLAMLRWERDFVSDDEPIFSKAAALHDFVLISFLVGNDFLPTIPTISILDGAIDTILSIYREVGKAHGHLTETRERGGVFFRRGALVHFFTEFGRQEKTMLEQKYNSQQPFFPDPLVIKNTRLVDQRHVIDMEAYKEEFYATKFGSGVPIEPIVREYIRGMAWILNYYENGIPDWTWFYPHCYGPFLSDFAACIGNDTGDIVFQTHEPVPPFLQMMMVLPGASKDLLPPVLAPLLERSSVLAPYFPESFEIDMTGKRKDWEGVVILPTLSFTAFRDEYQRLEKRLTASEQKRNIIGKNFVYRYDLTRSDVFSSFYGDIPECPVSVYSIFL